jgi:hypothetical protein
MRVQYGCAINYSLDHGSQLLAGVHVAAAGAPTAWAQLPGTTNALHCHPARSRLQASIPCHLSWYVSGVQRWLHGAQLVCRDGSLFPHTVANMDAVLTGPKPAVHNEHQCQTVQVILDGTSNPVMCSWSSLACIIMSVPSMVLFVCFHWCGPLQQLLRAVCQFLLNK